MTAPAMLASAGFDPRHTFLRPAEVFLRYGWKTSKGYDMLQSPGFPRRVGDKYRLDTLLAWEERELSGINVSDAAMAGPAAGVGGPFSAPDRRNPSPPSRREIGPAARPPQAKSPDGGQHPAPARGQAAHSAAAKRAWRSALYAPGGGDRLYRVTVKEDTDAGTWEWISRTASTEDEARELFARVEAALGAQLEPAAGALDAHGDPGAR